MRRAMRVCCSSDDTWKQTSSSDINILTETDVHFQGASQCLTRCLTKVRIYTVIKYLMMPRSSMFPIVIGIRTILFWRKCRKSSEYVVSVTNHWLPRRSQLLPDIPTPAQEVVLLSWFPLFRYFPIFITSNIHVRYWISRWSLTGVAAAQLLWQLPNMNVIKMMSQLLEI